MNQAVPVGVVQDPLHCRSYNGNTFTYELVHDQNGGEFRKIDVCLACKDAQGNREYRHGEKEVSFWITTDKSAKVALETIEAFACQTFSWTNDQLNDYFNRGQGGLSVVTKYDDKRPHEEGTVIIYQPTRCGNHLQPAFYGPGPMNYQGDRSKGDQGEYVRFDRDTLREIQQRQPRERRADDDDDEDEDVVGGGGVANVQGFGLGMQGYAHVRSPVGGMGGGLVGGALQLGQGIGVQGSPMPGAGVGQ